VTVFPVWIGQMLIGGDADGAEGYVCMYYSIENSGELDWMDALFPVVVPRYAQVWKIW
jgi:hypothetical protein